MDQIFEAIRVERAKQDAQWGGPNFDDTNEDNEWDFFIRKQLEQLSEMGSDPIERFVKIAALATAATESKVRQGLKSPYLSSGS